MVMLDPKKNFLVHRRDCGLWGPCDCDVRSWPVRLLRVLFHALGHPRPW